MFFFRAFPSLGHFGIPEEQFGSYLNFSQDSFETIGPQNLHYLSKPPNTDEIESPLYEFDVTLAGENSGNSSWVVSILLKD